MKAIELREKLAELAHEQWSGWIKYMFGKCDATIMPGKLVIPEWGVRRWGQQSCTPYDKLTPEEQDSDRVEADKFLAVLRAEPCKACGGSKRVPALWGVTQMHGSGKEFAGKTKPCPACEPTADNPEAGELKVTLHDKKHQIVGYFRLKSGWIQFATKDKPSDWAWPCSFRWNHHHCDLLDRQAHQIKTLTQRDDEATKLLSKRNEEIDRLTAELKEYGWILASEEMPLQVSGHWGSEEVYATDGKQVWVCKYNFSAEYWTAPSGDITHWMPIVLPKEK